MGSRRGEIGISSGVNPRVRGHEWPPWGWRMHRGERYEYHSGQMSSNRGQRYGGRHVKQEPGRERDEKDGSVRGPVCFSCGKRGHNKFDCPNKIA